MMTKTTTKKNHTNKIKEKQPEKSLLVAFTAQSNTAGFSDHERT